MIYHFGECAFDTSLYSVQRGGQSIRIRPKVFRVCLYLLKHRNRVVSREELCAQMWPGRFVSQATVEGVIRSVREVLGDSGRTQGIIQTARGYGYRFVAGIEEHAPEGVREEAPQTETPSVSTVSGILPRAAGIHVGGEVARARPAASGSGPARKERGWQPDANQTARDRPVAFLPEQQRAVRQPGAFKWWWVGGGWGLVMVALVLFGAFGLWLGTSHRASGPLEKSRIAVLPFMDISTEVDQAYFADGLTEQLIVQLAQIDGLTVIARRSVMQYKGSVKDVATIGRELRVGTVLEGSVRRLENRVRISAQLIDVTSQGHLWSQEYNRELTGVLAAQRDIATHLAEGLKVQFTPRSIHNHSAGGPPLIALVQGIGLGK